MTPPSVAFSSAARPSGRCQGQAGMGQGRADQMHKAKARTARVRSGPTSRHGEMRDHGAPDAGLRPERLPDAGFACAGRRIAVRQISTPGN